MWLHPQPAGVYKAKNTKLHSVYPAGRSSWAKQVLFTESEKAIVLMTYETILLKLGTRASWAAVVAAFKPSAWEGDGRIRENSFLKRVSQGRRLGEIWKEGSAVKSTRCPVWWPELGSQPSGQLVHNCLCMNSAGCLMPSSGSLNTHSHIKHIFKTPHWFLLLFCLFEDLFSVYECFACISVCLPQGTYRNGEPPCGCRESNPGPLQEQVLFFFFF